jgi:tetratricopeptide (TPR) repeat protein
MIASGKIQSAQIRAASHYLDKLYQINQAYISGGENVPFALKRFDAEWEQIRRWHEWAIDRAQYDTNIAKIGAAFTRVGDAILEIRLNNQEYLNWHQSGLRCSEYTPYDEFLVTHYLNLAHAYQRYHDYENSKHYAEQALKACKADHIHLLAQSYYRLGTVERRLANVDVARQYLEKSLAFYEQIYDLKEAAGIHYNLSSLAGMRGDFEMARFHLEQALPHFRRTGNSAFLANCLNNLGLVESLAGDLNLAQIYLQESLEISEKLGDRSSIAQALTNLASVMFKQGKFDHVYEYEIRSLEISRELGDSYGIATCLSNLGHIAIIRQQFDVAAGYFQQALAMNQDIGDRYSMVDNLSQLGRCSLAKDNFATAEQFFLQGIEIAREVQHQVGLIVGLRRFASVKMKQNALSDVRVMLQEALAISLDIQSEPIQLEVLLSIATFWHLRGETETAVSWLGLIMSHRATTPTLRHESGEFYTTLAQSLPQTAFAALLDMGKALSLDEILRDIQQQLESVNGA